MEPTMMVMTTNNLQDDLSDISNAFNEAMQLVEDESEKYWNSLSKDEQLKVFCAVSRRIFDGELKQKRSYRGVLYDVFQFGPEAYAPAQMSGYLSIHNAIVDADYDKNLISAFCKKFNIENAEEKFLEFLL